MAQIKKLVAKGQTVKRYCPTCLKVAKITITETALVEYWTCHRCGVTKTYRVR